MRDPDGGTFLPHTHVGRKALYSSSLSSEVDQRTALLSLIACVCAGNSARCGPSQGWRTEDLVRPHLQSDLAQARSRKCEFANRSSKVSDCHKPLPAAFQVYVGDRRLLIRTVGDAYHLINDFRTFVEHQELHQQACGALEAAADNELAGKAGNSCAPRVAFRRHRPSPPLLRYSQWAIARINPAIR
jgi:hypothetical protein